ncbi:response regulator [Deltaproteobacteria bacterium]|nr:response regulator [Deltaproteobacteria bacterium]
MSKFRDLSIKKKLTAIIMLATIAVLFIFFINQLLNAYFGLRNDLRARVTALGNVVALNCTEALIRGNQYAVKEILRGFEAEPYINFANIYTPDGIVFAEYIRKNAPVRPAPNAKKIVIDLISKGVPTETNYSDSFEYREGGVDVFEAIVEDGKIIGVIEVFLEFKEIDRVMWEIFRTYIIVLILCTLIAYPIATIAQRSISRPILILKAAMDEVSKINNYSTRIKKESSDELGALFDGFNKMLTEIQARDEKLLFTQFSVDHMGEAVFWFDFDANIINTNNTACDTLGYSREEILSMKIFDIDPDAQKDKWFEQWEKIRSQKFIVYESLHRKKDGNLFPVEVYVSYFKFKDKEYRCAVVRDVSERKALQSKLEQAHKMEAIGTLAGGVAHDLNNILGSVVGYPDLILMDLPEDSPLKESLTEIKKSGEKAAAIVQDMLALARRGVDLQKVVNLNEIITEYLKSPEHERVTHFHPNIRFKVRLEEDLPNIMGSHIHLSKALMNLISNAAEATLDYEGEIIISTSSRYLESSYKGYQTITEGNYSVLSIEDNGFGISTEDMTKIFEPFYTKKVMGRSGTGLGMSVVSGTIKDCKGFIDLKSKKEGGTRFDLYFPITTRVLDEKEPPPDIEACKGSERVLVVDDVEEQRKIATHFLNVLGYQVNTVSSGEEALEYLKENHAEILILDMIMDPGIDGLETYKKILDINPGQKAIIASGYTQTDQVNEVLKLGAGAYVKKPYTLHKLGSAIRSELDR